MVDWHTILKAKVMQVHRVSMSMCPLFKFNPLFHLFCALSDYDEVGLAPVISPVTWSTWGTIKNTMVLVLLSPHVFLYWSCFRGFKHFFETPSHNIIMPEDSCYPS